MYNIGLLHKFLCYEINVFQFTTSIERQLSTEGDNGGKDGGEERKRKA